MPETALVQGHELFETAITDLLELAAVPEQPAPDLTIDVTVDESVVLLTITDTGKTIPQADLTALTTQIESPLEHAEGIELWLIRWTIEYSGGGITVDSVDGVPRIRVRLVRALTSSELES